MAADLDEAGEHEEGDIKGSQDDHANELIARQAGTHDAQGLADQQQLKVEREEHEKLHHCHLVAHLHHPKIVLGSTPVNECPIENPDWKVSINDALQLLDSGWQ